MYYRNCKETSVAEHLSNNDKISSLINEMLDCLPKEQQDCARMFYVEEKNQGQIAKELGIPLWTVKSRLSKSKERIGEMVLEFQKKGTKSYDFSPILLFWWFNKNCSETENSTTDISSKSAGKVLKNTGISMSKMLSLVAVTGLATATAVGIGVRVNKPDALKSSIDETVSDGFEMMDAIEERKYQNSLMGKMIDMTEYEDFVSGNGNVLAARKNGRWCLLDYDGNMILEPTYQTLFSYPNENGYTIFDKGNEFCIVGRDGKVHAFRGDIANIAIGEDDIVTYITEYSHAAARQCVVYQKLNGEVIFRLNYRCYGEDVLYHNSSNYVTAFHEGKAYLPETFEEGADIVELSTDGSNSRLHIHEDPSSSHFSVFMPIGSCADGYVAGQFLPGSGIALLDTESMKRSECIESLSVKLFPEKFTDNDQGESFALQVPSFGMNFYDANGECYNYKTYGCLWVAFDDRISKDVLFDYFSVGEEGRLEECIAIYDRILFDDFEYLAVKNGEEWFYIDYQGNVMSKTYKEATPFNDEGYALVLESDGNAYVIDSTFQVVENAGPAVSVEICGEMFAIDHRYLFCYGEKYL